LAGRPLLPASVHPSGGKPKAEIQNTLMAYLPETLSRQGRLSPRIVAILALAATIISLSMGLRQSLGLFLPPLNAELAISASAFGLAMALQNIVWGVAQPIVGMFGDRYGARPILIASAAIYALGLTLMASTGTRLGLDGGLGVMVGLGISGTSYGVLIGSVSRLVPAERRSQAVGLVSAAGSVATLGLAPLGQILIASFGWSIALFVFAGFACSIAALAVFIGREGSAGATAEESDAATHPSMAKALRSAAGHPGFVAMTIAFFACGFQLAFITTHLAQFLAICGIASNISAAAIGVIGISNAVGSYVFGVLGSRYSPKRLLAAIYLLRTISIILFTTSPVTPFSTIVFAAAMGFLWLGVIPLVSGLVGKLFGLHYFNTLFGVAFFSHQVGGFLGAWLGGVVFDLTGSYARAWLSMVVVGLTAAAIQWFMDDRARPIDRVSGALPVPASA
jgi:predicted MFS family arabinose efflux permease